MAACTPRPRGAPSSRSPSFTLCRRTGRLLLLGCARCATTAGPLHPLFSARNALPLDTYMAPSLPG